MRQQPLLAAKARTFLESQVPVSFFEVFPEWQGCLMTIASLKMAVWIVRDYENGRQLAEETGEPALLLEDLLLRGGQSSEEARTALLPRLISPGECDEQKGDQKQNEVHEKP